MPMRHWWLPAATGVAGLVAGILVSGLVGAGGAAPSATVASERSAGVLTTEDVRRVVREELVARDSTPARATPTPGAASAAPAATAPVAPSASQTSAAQQAESILAAAISRRTWTETDAASLREIFHDMSAEQQAETLRQFAVAVNQERLSPQTERIPF